MGSYRSPTSYTNLNLNTMKESTFIKAKTRLGNKSYDDIIGKLICSMIDLEDYITVHEPGKLNQIKELKKDLEYFDEYMSYGNNS